MTLRVVLAYLHLLTLGIGFYSIWTRANALKKLTDKGGLPEVFRADNFWGLAAGLWIATGLWRAFGGLEKGTDYYVHNAAFLIKMSLFLLVFAIELKPMIILIRWRTKNKKGEAIDFSQARQLAFMSHIQLGLLAIIIFFATAMARGVWY
jgi:putative membrane protein